MERAFQTHTQPLDRQPKGAAASRDAPLCGASGGTVNIWISVIKTLDMDYEGSISRRTFVKAASLTATAITTGIAATAESQAAAAKPMIGFQAEVTYVMQYGITRFLDDIQNRASVNTLMPHCNLFEASWAGLDRASNPVGNFAAAHPQFYKDVNMQPHPLSPGDFNLPDAMQKITAETKKRGMKIIPWMEEDNRPRPLIKGMDEPLRSRSLRAANHRPPRRTLPQQPLFPQPGHRAGRGLYPLLRY